MRIVIVDYGMGNIKSLSSALKYTGVDELIISNQEIDIERADKLILPGVGAFPKAISNIRQLKIDRYLHNAVLENKKPILGICLGMQLMSEGSDEGGINDGLGFISGKVRKFGDGLKIPHVGFNQVIFSNKSRIYTGLDDGSDFYFTHSYKMNSDKSINQNYCNYGDDFIASYELDNIAGVQFHPELSQVNGLRLLQNFLEKF